MYGTGRRRKGIRGITTPIDYLTHELAGVHLGLQNVLSGIEQRSLNVVIAELVVGAYGRY
jgi:hypothetical protein